MPYIEQSIIDKFTAKEVEGKFNYKKLLKLLDQLNKAYDESREYTCYLLIKAILNHIPPLLGQSDFNAMVGNHGWSSTSHKSYAKDLKDNFIEEAHDVTHTRISAREDHLSLETITNNKTRLNTVLEECATHTVATVPSFPLKVQKIKAPATKVSFDSNHEPILDWANFGIMGLPSTPSFRCWLHCDNYENNKQNYITNVVLTTKLADGSTYTSTKFAFNNQTTGARFKVAANEIIDTVVLILVDCDPAALIAPFPLPNIDTKDIKVTFYFADKTEATLDVQGIQKA